MGLKDTVKIKLNSITFSDGSEYSPDEKELIVLAGPNNCGKSEALKNIKQLLTDNSNKSNYCITNLEKQNIGTQEELLTYFDDRFSKNGEQYHVGTIGIPQAHQSD